MLSVVVDEATDVSCLFIDEADVVFSEFIDEVKDVLIGVVK